MLRLFLCPASTPIPQRLHKLCVVVAQILSLQQETQGFTVFRCWSHEAFTWPRGPA